MTSFNQYQKQATTTNKYQSDRGTLAILTLGLTGEAGEVADKIKKMYRDLNGELSIPYSYEIAKELGDVLWYLTRSANELGYTLTDIAEINVVKLTDRQERGVLGGSGDTR